MTKQDYSEQRRDPRWQRKRLEIMQRDNFKCRECDGADKPLNVHHAYYVKDRDVWDYPRFALQTLCENCHALAHEHREIGESESRMANWEDTLDHLLGRAPDERLIDILWDLSYESSIRKLSLLDLLEFVKSKEIT